MNETPTLADCDPGAIDVQRVLVIRALPGIGDLLCAVPALRALRQAWPLAEIAMLGLPVAEPVLQRAGGHVDRVIPFRGWPGVPESPNCDVRAMARAMSDLQRERFDLVLQMHGTGVATNPLALLVGGRLTVGWRVPGSPPLAGGSFFQHPPGLNEIHRLTALVGRLGLPLPADHLEFAVGADEVARGHELLGLSPAAPDNGAGQGSEPYVCLHPGASQSARRWPTERFAAVGDALAAQGLRVVVTGGRDEEDVVGAVAEAMEAPVVNLAGRLSLGTLAAVLSGASLAVTNDTGVSHLCAARRTPSVIVFVASDPARWAPLDRERHRAVVAAPVDAAGRPPGPPSVTAVLREALGLLAEDPRVSPADAASPEPVSPEPVSPDLLTGSGTP